MAHLHLENIGPISIVDVDLRRYNVFIGPQSSGKSTIAKLISFCSWAEKRAATTLSENIFANAEDFQTQAEDYHKMHGYFNTDSVLEYRSDIIQLKYKHSGFSLKLIDKTAYQRKKILYIPSDRNLVAMDKLDRLIVETNTNLRGFMFDWFDARETYGKEHHLNILDLNMEYYYDKDAKVNKDRIIHTNGKTYEIALPDASSGLQSVIPLTLLLSYFSNQYFARYWKTTSYEKEKEQHNLREKINLLYPIETLGKDSAGISHTGKELKSECTDTEGDVEANALMRRFLLFDQLTKPCRTDFIIEEPEQNLFPSTQTQLISHILRVCNETGLEHSFTLTTHSPYILAQLNILLFAGMLENQGKSEDVKKTVAPLSVVKPQELGVYAVQNNGTIETILDEKTGLISQNYLDSASIELSEKFQHLYQLLF